MVTVVLDVRNVTGLNSDEITDARVTAFIADATAWVDESGADPTDGDWGERACKYRASYLSYVLSNTYLQASAGPINVREAYENKAAFLKRMSEAALNKALGKTPIVTKKIPLLRDRTADEQESPSDEIDLVVR